MQEKELKRVTNEYELARKDLEKARKESTLRLDELKKLE